MSLGFLRNKTAGFQILKGVPAVPFISFWSCLGPRTHQCIPTGRVLEILPLKSPHIHTSVRHLSAYNQRDWLPRLRLRLVRSSTVDLRRREWALKRLHMAPSCCGSKLRGISWSTRNALLKGDLGAEGSYRQPIPAVEMPV